MSRAPRSAAHAPPAETPIMRQYRAAKAEHPDAFLFFRLGDFYELFHDDAVTAAGLLGLTLTSRNKQDPSPIPMCGVPWHQRDGYVARLLKLGHKVAICEQLEEAAPGRKIVARGVTEVLTPGSVTSDTFLEAHANNFLAALWPAGERIGVCLADASTGELRLLETRWDEGRGELGRAAVAEWLLPEGLEPEVTTRLAALLDGLPGARSHVPVARFLDERVLPARWDEPTLERHADLPRALAAAAAALDYLARAQGGEARQMTRLERWDEGDSLRVDAATQRHLELFAPQPGGEVRHTLWHHLDLTVTAPGARRLRAWLSRPLTRRDAIVARQDAVAAWLAPDAPRGSFRESLRGLPDLERLAARVACARATPRDLGALRDALARLPDLAAGIATLGPAATAVAGALRGSPALGQRLREALVDEPPPLSREGGILRPGYDPVRDALDDLAHSGKRWVAELEAAERERSGIPSLKVGFNKVFGYYLEITNAHRDRVPADYERRQTLTTAERYVTPALKARESEILGAEEKLRAREHERFVELRAYAAGFVADLQRAADAIAALDAEASLAEAAARYGWVRPVLEDSDRLELVGARHPVVERLLPRGEFVPNDVCLAGGTRQILLLTGPNMGGKSTYLRQVALAFLLAQCGSWVPAARATIGLADRLFTRVGAADRLGAGQSTFMVEMSETADILRSATSRSVVLLDEIGRGTATYDGLALAWAVTEHLHGDAVRPRTIFATHYHELTQLAERLPRLANVHVTVKELGDHVVFLHRVADGAADRSYGIHVARLAGLPEPLLARAREVLAELESERTAEHLGLAGAGRVAEAPPELPLFAREAPPVLDALRGVDPERLTPLEALTLLSEWKRRWGGA